MLPLPNALIDKSVPLYQEWWFIFLVFAALTYLFVSIFKKISYAKREFVSSPKANRIDNEQFRMYLLFFGSMLPVTELFLEVFKVRAHSEFWLNSFMGFALLGFYYLSARNNFIKKHFRTIFFAKLCVARGLYHL